MKTLLKISLGAAALPLCVTALVALAGNKTATLYAVTNLGPGSAFKASNPVGSGTFLVVGSTPDPDVNVRAIVWTVTTDGTVDDVFLYDKTLGASQAIDVNDHGIIIGSWQQGAFVDVPGVGVKLLPEALNAFGVNNNGVVVGYIPVATAPGINGAVWYVDATGNIDGPVVTNISSGATFVPLDVNDEGMMSGFIVSSGNPDTSAAIAEFDRNGELDVQDLGVMHHGDTGASLASINNDDVAVGSSSAGSPAAILWTTAQAKKLIALGDLGGGVSLASDVNDNCQIVGWSVTRANTRVGFIWQDGKMVDLNTMLVAPSNDTLFLALGINNTGHIVGLLQSRNACVLTPR